MISNSLVSKLQNQGSLYKKTFFYRFQTNIPLLSPLKTRKTKGFLIFSGWIKKGR